MKQFVTTIEASEPALREELVQRIGPENIAEINNSIGVAWLPVDINFNTTRSLTRTLGLDGAEDFVNQVYRNLMERSIFQPLIRGIQSFGPSDPGAYLKHATRGYDMAFREVGRVEVAEGTPTSIDLEFTGLMPECFDPEIPWVRYSRAAYRLAFDFSGVPGSIDLPVENPQLRTSRLHCHWTLD